jgi:hypothetical protein
LLQAIEIENLHIAIVDPKASFVDPMRGDRPMVSCARPRLLAMSHRMTGRYDAADAGRRRIEPAAAW